MENSTNARLQTPQIPNTQSSKKKHRSQSAGFMPTDFWPTSRNISRNQKYEIARFIPILCSFFWQDSRRSHVLLIIRAGFLQNWEAQGIKKILTLIKYWIPSELALRHWTGSEWTEGLNSVNLKETDSELREKARARQPRLAPYLYASRLLQRACRS